MRIHLDRVKSQKKISPLSISGDSSDSGNKENEGKKEGIDVVVNQVTPPPTPATREREKSKEAWDFVENEE